MTETRNILQTDTAEMKNVNTKRKTESDIRIFKDCLPTVGELRSPEDIGVEEMSMHLGIFFFQRARNQNKTTNLIHYKQQAIICNKEESCRSNQCMPAAIKTNMIPESSHYINKKKCRILVDNAH